jgi:hypothetical protein
VGEKSYFIDLSDAGPTRIRVRIKSQRGRVIDLVIQLEIWTQGRWQAVARYDCAHGYPHLDLLPRQGAREKIKLGGSTLDEIVNNAIDDFKLNWQEYLRRYGYDEA